MIKDEQNKKRDNSKGLIPRLYYGYHFKKLGFKDVKGTINFTEFITLNFVKKNYHYLL